MSGPQFFQTQMGQRYYEHTLPALVRELARLNTNLERLLKFATPAEAAGPVEPKKEQP